MITALMSMSAFAASGTATVKIKGVMCSACSKAVQAELLKNDAVASANVDKKKGLVNIAFKDGKNMSDDQIKSLIQAAGDEFKVGPISRQ
jgi:copper chaperone CopZ